MRSRFNISEPIAEARGCLSATALWTTGKNPQTICPARARAIASAPGRDDFEQIERAVFDLARCDVFKLSEALLGGQIGCVTR